MKRPVQKIVSGGQTGVDQAALDWAIRHGFDHGGWCPRGRRTESGPAPPRFRLIETPSAEYAQRTEWNVRDSDATVIFSSDPELADGTLFTRECVIRWGRPLLHLVRDGNAHASRELAEFCRSSAVRVLNVAGPRQSGDPAMGPFVDAVLTRAFSTEESDPSGA